MKVGDRVRIKHWHELNDHKHQRREFFSEFGGREGVITDELGAGRYLMEIGIHKLHVSIDAMTTLDATPADISREARSIIKELARD